MHGRKGGSSYSIVLDERTANQGSNLGSANPSRCGKIASAVISSRWHCGGLRGRPHVTLPYPVLYAVHVSYPTLPAAFCSSGDQSPAQPRMPVSTKRMIVSVGTPNVPASRRTGGGWMGQLIRLPAVSGPVDAENANHESRPIALVLPYGTDTLLLEWVIRPARNSSDYVVSVPCSLTGVSLERLRREGKGK
ncbi:uncharacterized protein CIMG_13571 [Coccidioides immitis RS]|uniref:Uncharacterized protein n=1 Tax=Coccidioides immitis (strain RS) TaxID=246410 RepID=J3K1I1_COCIM|nr:uncharacterized protein CIMG_13571 [Coccidioides immitis RS]EAS27838.3 hypothetical protein CIMG_13571 [Coccidioides immitis RS]